MTDVFFLTKGLAGTTAFLSPLAPPMAKGRDLLREALDAAHERGMRLHAWFTSASDEHFKNEHPDCGLCHYTKGRNRGIVSIACAAYIRYMQDALAFMLRGYDVDGVHLDYIRYNHLIYGWSEEDQARCAARGVDLAHVRRLMDETFREDAPNGEAIFDAFRSGDGDALALARSRRADVVAFARALCETVRAEKPGAIVSAALMPEGAYDDLAFADLHYGQNYGDLSALMDAFLPMAYSRAYDQDAEWVGRVARGTLRYGVRTLVGVQAYEGGTGLTLPRDIEAALAPEGVGGVCLFREGAAVWAFVSGRTMSLFNPLPAAVTACRVAGPDGSRLIDARVEPGSQREVPLPFVPETVQAYAGGEEVCVLTVREV